jgi:hypothetical protein
MAAKLTLWAVQCNTARKPWLYPYTFRLRREAHNWFFEYAGWEGADRSFRTGNCSIVKVHVEVIE